ncbi:MAG: F0F1 ATP synthase subunit delta [Legionella sp.]|nr:MAG: F0F1 ATP synthase subunit delta [Legionella sp.]
MADMTSIARPYSKAAFEFAVEHQQIGAWADLLERVTQIVLDPLCVAFITNPSSTPKQHSELILNVLQAYKTTEVKQTQQFIELLAHNKRLLVVPSIFKLFQELRASYEKTLTVDVISFSALSKDQEAELTTRLSRRLQRDITLAITIDPTILGGAIIRAGNLVFDGSVRTQIRTLSTTLAA